MKRLKALVEARPLGILTFQGTALLLIKRAFPVGGIGSRGGGEMSDREARQFCASVPGADVRGNLFNGAVRLYEAFDWRKQYMHAACSWRGIGAGAAPREGLRLSHLAGPRPRLELAPPTLRPPAPPTRSARPLRPPGYPASTGTPRAPDGDAAPSRDDAPGRE